MNFKICLMHVVLLKSGPFIRPRRASLLFLQYNIYAFQYVGKNPMDLEYFISTYSNPYTKKNRWKSSGLFEIL